MLKSLCRASIILLALLFIGCTAAPSKNVTLDAATGNGLIIIGTTGNIKSVAVTLTIDKFDPTSKKLIPTPITSRGEIQLFKSKNKIQFDILELPEGNYILKSISWLDGFNSRVNCLSEGTFYFYVKPGRLGYLGNIGYNKSRVSFVGFDRLGAEEYLQAYENLNVGELERLELRRTTFQTSRNLINTQEICKS